MNILRLEYQETDMPNPPSLSSSGAMQEVATPSVLGNDGTTPNRLHHFFERSVARSPGATAVWHEGQRWTYGDLEYQANLLARHLIRRGVRPGQRIGLLFERCGSMYISLLATLKCGAVFVPLDPTFPPERMAFIAEDASLNLVLTHAKCAEAASHIGRLVLDVDAVMQSLATASAARPMVQEGEQDACYILYTSGTTGRPKGVVISHASICNFINVCLPIYGYTSRDRVYQGMTLAFDFSIEEIWPTFAVGATLIAGPTDHRRFGAGLAQFLIDNQVSVVCCVPTLLATLDRDIPTLRTLLVGGEPCSQDLVRRWSRSGRRMLNTYGPTETTVTASWCELSPDAPVTIGVAMPTYSLYLLDDRRQPVAPGAAGEICIAGPGVAVGYLNRPELTEERFILNPFRTGKDSATSRGLKNDRLYRTGDLGRLTPDGQIEYLGRIDNQVKIRGYRIELSEIEAILLEHDAVRHAVVHAVTGEGGVTDLVGYVVIDGDFDSIALRQQLFTSLRRQLPVYMVPAYLEKLDAIPMLPSNKVDRARLPSPTGPRFAVDDDSTGIAPETALEREIAACWSQVFGKEVRSVEADFFLDLGGHSLFAALVVSNLRQRPNLQHVAIADIYTCPSVRTLARHLEKYVPPSSKQHTDQAPVRRRHSSRRVWVAGVVQLATLLISLIPWLAPGLLALLVLQSETLSVGAMVGWVAVAIIATPVISLLSPIAAKWLLFGKVRPGRYPLWGWFFCRWWLVRKLLQTAPFEFLAGSPLMAPYFRLLGAKIGRGCHLGSGRIDVPDLVEIGDGASIGYNVDIDPAHVAGGWLTISPVRIGSGAYIGTNSVISGGAVVGAQAKVVEQSLVASGQNIPDNETWAGSPSRPTSSDPQLELLASKEPAPRNSLGLSIAYALGFMLVSNLPLLLVVPSLVLIWGISQGDFWLGLALTPAAGLLHVICTCVLVIVGKRLALPSLKPGVYPLHSWFGFRKWIADRLMALSLTTTNSLYSTLYLSPFLRALGTRIGARAEISTVSHIDPDLLTLGKECFVADLAVIGAARFHNGYIALGETTLGERVFIGNAALVPGDTSLNHDSLIGVLSITPHKQVETGTSWLGSPAIFLPRRQASEKFDESLTYNPPVWLIACRLAIEFFRVILPSTLTLAAMFLFAQIMIAMLDEVAAGVALAALGAVYLGVGLLMTFVVAGLKWLLMGRYRPRVDPQWSHFVWRTELITGVYENVAVPWFFHWVAGTPFMAPALRLFGARVGKRSYFESHFITEFDLVQVGSDTAIGGHASLQTHLFEDRVMKMSKLTVGDNCSVGARSVVLYDSVLEAGAELEALSLAMKGEKLPSESRWRGIPAELVE